MDDEQFWSLIESAWRSVGGKASERQKLLEGKLSEQKAEGLVEAMEELVQSLRRLLDQLPAEELLAFDRILERKLYEIDRGEIQEHTDGSDDGFLYARGFIVAAGKLYYDAVNAHPATALMDMECEEMCYLPWRLYRTKFGEAPPSGISRESCSNKAAWTDF